MKKILTLSAAMMLLASMAMAGGVGLYVGTDCNPTLAAAQNVSNACTSNTGSAFTAFGTCIIPAVTKVQFVGSMSIIDVQSALSATPDWWRADACRSTGFALSADGSIAGALNCTATLWDAAAPAGSNITALNAVGGANRIRLLLGSVLLPTAVYDLQGDDATELAVFKLTVSKTKSVGTGACTGCSSGACIVLNEVQLQGMLDANFGQYIHITGPILANSNYINYNSANNANCAGSTPTENRTWGSLKALYR